MISPIAILLRKLLSFAGSDMILKPARFRKLPAVASITDVALGGVSRQFRFLVSMTRGAVKFNQFFMSGEFHGVSYAASIASLTS